ncbi:hypothetical protein Tco_1227312 [Tanacetum coccineum]
MEFEFCTEGGSLLSLPILKLGGDKNVGDKNHAIHPRLEPATHGSSNETQQLTFSQYTDAKTMFAAIETQFGGNEATKKTQKTLLKQQYRNFSASSAESIDSIFNRL